MHRWLVHRVHAQLSLPLMQGDCDAWFPTQAADDDVPLDLGNTCSPIRQLQQLEGEGLPHLLPRNACAATCCIIQFKEFKTTPYHGLI